MAAPKIACAPPPRLGVFVPYRGGSEPAQAGSGSGQRLPPDMQLSPQARNIAEIVGLSDLLVEIAAREGSVEPRTDGERLHLLELRQQLSDRLLLTSLALSSVTAEVACEETRADHAANRLQEAQERRTRKSLIISIVGDAMIGILGGALSLAGQAVGTAIADMVGGGVATGFGLEAFSDREAYRFQHRRNLLREIWEGPQQSKLFPRPVWRYLTTPAKDGTTLRQDLVADWRRHGFLGEPGSDTEKQRIALIFGEGGVYNIDELRLRAEMFELLTAATDLMNQDLHVLFRELMIRKSAGYL